MSRRKNGARGDAAAGSSYPRVLVALGNFALNGQERGNIEVFYAAKEVGVEALFVTHEAWGHHYIQPALDERGLAWTTLDYARHFTKRLSFGGWVQNIGRLLKASWAFGRIARQYRPTHIHVANPHYFLSVLPALLLMRTPVVFRLGDVPTQHHVFYRVLWHRCIVPRTQTFVCVSEYVRQKAVEAGVPTAKARVIYSYPPERPDSHDSGSPGLEPFDGHTVVFVGQIAPHKGVDLLVQVAIDLCKMRDDIRVLVAGSLIRQNPFGLGLFGKVKALGLEDQIRFLGYQNDIPGLLSQGDVHVCPSVWEEPLSNTVVEAKKAGLPSVIFRSGGLPELVEHKRDGFVCREKTAAALKEGIAYFLDAGDDMLRAASEEARASLGRLGITKARFAQAWREVYEGEPPSASAGAEGSA